MSQICRSAMKSIPACSAGVALCAWFNLAAAATITTFDAAGGQTKTYPQSISQAGITGYYYDSGNASHGFVRAVDGTITTFDVPGSVDTNARSINTNGTVTGDYHDGSLGHGFVRAADGTIATFDVPGSVYTVGFGISAHGAIA